MRHFIFLSYKGTSYHGWQSQPSTRTVQADVEKALSLLLREEITVTGAGRTDTGVHASYYVAHFDSKNADLISGDLKYKLNGILDKDIAISDIKEVVPEAHARFDAISRTYRYLITRVKDPFSISLKSFIPDRLDLEAMNKAAGYMLDYIDFTSFSKLHTDVKTNNCSIEYARWTEDNENIIFEIKADRFLRNMVRAIVGTHLDIGRAKISPEDIKTIIEAKQRGEAGKSVEAKGLYLYNIEYPTDIFIL